jgi:hypothetical protein
MDSALSIMRTHGSRSGRVATGRSNAMIDSGHEFLLEIINRAEWLLKKKQNESP